MTQTTLSPSFAPSRTEAPSRLRPATLYLFAGKPGGGGVHVDDQLNSLVRSPHEIAICLTSNRQPFRIKLGKDERVVQAVAASHGKPRNVDARGSTAIVFRVAPSHRLFRVLSACKLMTLDRDAFGDLDEQFIAMAAGPIDPEQVHTVYKTILERVARLLPAAPPLDPRVRNVLRMLEKGLDRSLESLAEEIGVSPSRLSHLITESLGMSLRSYQAWRRVIVAWDYFVSGSTLSMTEIAHRNGFADSSHFARTFHKFTGYTPTQARNPEFTRIIATT